MVSALFWGDFYVISKEEAMIQFENAKKFVDETERYILSLGDK